jgi:hypothetical protein
MAVCQSCGMRIDEYEDHGTNFDGEINKEYCKHCFQNGNFTEPDIKLQEQIEKSTSMVEKMGWSKEKAHHMEEATIPRLKRWRK